MLKKIEEKNGDKEKEMVPNQTKSKKCRRAGGARREKALKQKPSKTSN